MVGRKTTFEVIANDLRRRINDGEFLPGQLLPAESELGAIYGLSRSSVRKALAVLEEEKLLHRCPGIGSRVGSAPESRSLRQVYIDLPVCVPGKLYYSMLWAAMQEVFAGESGWRLLPLPPGAEAIPVDADALIVTHGKRIQYPMLSRAAARMPVIMLNRIDAPAGVHSLWVDYRQESFAIVNRLLQNRCRKIVLVGDTVEPTQYTLGQRSAGVRDALLANGIELTSEVLVGIQEMFVPESIAVKILRVRPDLLFVASEEQLGAALAALESVRRELAVFPQIFSFDDTTVDYRLDHYRISCFRMPLKQLSETAADILTGRRQGENGRPIRRQFSVQVLLNSGLDG